MVKFRSWLLKNWSSASWNIFLCNKFIFFVYVYKKFSQVTVFLGEILTFSCNHFSAILLLPWDSNTTLIITFIFVSSYLVEQYQGFSNYLWRNKENCAYQNYAKNLTKSLSKLSSLSFLHKKWRLFKPNTYAKKRYFHTTAAFKQTTAISIKAFDDCNTHYNDEFLDTVKLLPKSVIGL